MRKVTKSPSHQVTRVNQKQTALIFALIFGSFVLGLAFDSCAENADLELAIDTAAETISLPKVFKPNVDLSGRGFNREMVCP